MHDICTNVHVCCPFLHRRSQKHIHDVPLEWRPAKGVDVHLQQNEDHKCAFFHTRGSLFDNQGLIENPTLSMYTNVA